MAALGGEPGDRPPNHPHPNDPSAETSTPLSMIAPIPSENGVPVSFARVAPSAVYSDHEKLKSSLPDSSSVRAVWGAIGRINSDQVPLFQLQFQDSSPISPVTK